MTSPRRWGVVACAACLGVTAWIGVAHLERQHARIDTLTKELADAKDQIETLRATESKFPAPVIINAGSSNSPTADAIAERVLAANDARAHAQAAIQDDARTPSVDQLAARAAATRTLDNAIARGRLRREDVLATRQILADDPAGRAEIARQISVALNTNKVVPEDPRAIFP